MLASRCSFAMTAQGCDVLSCVCIPCQELRDDEVANETEEKLVVAVEEVESVLGFRELGEASPAHLELDC